MARICVQCDKKIGLFKTPIEEIYCYNTCRDAARHDIAENERRSAERKVQEEHAAQVAEERAAEAVANARADAALKATCPKCGAPGNTRRAGRWGDRATARSVAFRGLRQIEKCLICPHVPAGQAEGALPALQVHRD